MSRLPAARVDRSDLQMAAAMRSIAVSSAAVEARLEGVDQLLLPGRKLTGILTGQQHGLGGQAVRDGVKFRVAFPRGRARASALF